MWEIRETRDYPRRRKAMREYKDDSYDDSYDAGYEDGYREAMKEAKHYYSEKGSYGRKVDDER